MRTPGTTRGPLIVSATVWNVERLDITGALVPARLPDDLTALIHAEHGAKLRPYGIRATWTVSLIGLPGVPDGTLSGWAWDTGLIAHRYGAEYISLDEATCGESMNATRGRPLLCLDQAIAAIAVGRLNGLWVNRRRTASYGIPA